MNSRLFVVCFFIATLYFASFVPSHSCDRIENKEPKITFQLCFLGRGSTADPNALVLTLNRFGRYRSLNGLNLNQENLKYLFSSREKTSIILNLEYEKDISVQVLAKSLSNLAASIGPEHELNVCIRLNQLLIPAEVKH